MKTVVPQAAVLPYQQEFVVPQAPPAGIACCPRKSREPENVSQMDENYGITGPSCRCCALSSFAFTVQKKPLENEQILCKRQLLVVQPDMSYVLALCIGGIALRCCAHTGLWTSMQQWLLPS